MLRPFDSAVYYGAVSNRGCTRKAYYYKPTMRDKTHFILWGLCLALSLCLVLLCTQSHYIWCHTAPTCGAKRGVCTSACNARRRGSTNNATTDASVQSPWASQLHVIMCLGDRDSWRGARASFNSWMSQSMSPKTITLRCSEQRYTKRPRWVRAVTATGALRVDTNALQDVIHDMSTRDVLLCIAPANIVLRPDAVRSLWFAHSGLPNVALGWRGGILTRSRRYQDIEWYAPLSVLRTVDVLDSRLGVLLRSGWVRNRAPGFVRHQRIPGTMPNECGPDLSIHVSLLLADQGITSAVLSAAAASAPPLRTGLGRFSASQTVSTAYEPFRFKRVIPGRGT